jgi:hypothetical protein
MNSKNVWCVFCSILMCFGIWGTKVDSLDSKVDMLGTFGVVL